MATGIRWNLGNVSWSNENSNSLALALEPGCASWKCDLEAGSLENESWMRWSWSWSASLELEMGA